ncbi:hypothetical protein J27TS7_32420 [Paenibacillus dendritiformis]|nr:hypothetical protein J27TS7_32420 [Paenibacillus dendritiformis]
MNGEVERAQRGMVAEHFGQRAGFNNRFPIAFLPLGLLIGSSELNEFNRLTSSHPGREKTAANDWREADLRR